MIIHQSQLGYDMISNLVTQNLPRTFLATSKAHMGNSLLYLSLVKFGLNFSFQEFPPRIHCSYTHIFPMRFGGHDEQFLQHSL